MALIRKTLEQIKKEKELSNEIKYRYDNDIDAIYFTLVDVPSIDSEEIAEGIIVDYDAENNIIGIEILDFFNKVENGLTIDDLLLTDEQKERMPKYLFIKDEDIDYSDIPELTDEDFGDVTWINYNEQSFYHWWMLPLRMNIKLWLKYINNEDVCFWQSLSGGINRQKKYFGYKFT